MRNTIKTACRAILLLGGLVAAHAQAQSEFFDDFDSYADSSEIVGQGGWEYWDDNPAFGAPVSNAQSLSFPNSLFIAGDSDVVQRFSGLDSGRVIVTAHVYVPTNYSGRSYVILLNTYVPLGQKNWSNQTVFDSESNTVISETNFSSLPMIRDAWTELRIEIDLNTDVQTVYYGGQLLDSGSWTNGISGGGVAVVDALDFFGNFSTGLYIDNVSIARDLPVPVPATNRWALLMLILAMGLVGPRFVKRRHA